MRRNAREGTGPSLHLKVRWEAGGVMVRGFSELFCENCGLHVVERQEEEQVMRAALQELPEALRNALIMRYTMIYSSADISLRTNILEDKVIGLTESAAHMVRNKVRWDYERLANKKVTLATIDEVVATLDLVEAV